MVLATVLLGTSLPLADTTSMNVGRFFIARALDSSSDETRWLTAGYSLFVAIGIPLSHRLRSFFSERTLYALATLVFMGGSVVSMFSHFMPSMMVGRALQGMAGGVLLPLSLALVNESFPESSRAQGLTLFSLGNALAVSLGPTIGGYLVDYANWRWTMGIHLPIGFATLIFVHLSLEEHPRQDPRRFDLPGWLLYSASAFFFMYSVMEGERFGWHSQIIFQTFFIFLALFFFYVLWAARFPDPIFPLDLFRYPGFVILTVVNLLRSVSVFGRLYLLPLYLEIFYHFQAHQAGFLIMTGAMVELMIPVLAALVPGNLHFPWLAISLGSFLLGLSSVAYLNLPGNAFSVPETVLPNLVFGVGMAMVQVSLAPLVRRTLPVPLERVGNVFQLAVMFLGGMIGTILGRHLLDNLAPVFHVQIPLSPLSESTISHGAILLKRLSGEYSYNIAFWVMGLISIGASALSVSWFLFDVLPRRLRQSTIRGQEDNLGA
jgi:EmrB/QacA subfamily drug resistance transporter